jgi:hypothetical protein
MARALQTARRMLDGYEAPPLDPAIDEALLARIREREAVLPNDRRSARLGRPHPNVADTTRTDA